VHMLSFVPTRDLSSISMVPIASSHPYAGQSETYSGVNQERATSLRDVILWSRRLVVQARVAELAPRAHQPTPPRTQSAPPHAP
jgi:hypothetical protein